MGQTLNSRPISQQQGFSTLNTASNPMASIFQKMMGFQPGTDVAMPAPVPIKTVAPKIPQYNILGTPQQGLTSFRAGARAPYMMNQQY